jgi:O-antigen/teichoic acid export membrane protein
MSGLSLAKHVRRLGGHAVVYGSADVASQVINLVLSPVFVHYLDPKDMGILVILLLFASVCKIIFRMGLDAGFFRIHFDQETEADKRAHAGSIVLFSGAAGLALFLILVASAPWATRLLFEGAHTAVSPLLVILVSTDIYLGTFLFVPLAMLRIRGRAGRFATLTTVRNFANTVLKVAFLYVGWGVPGVILSDVCATALLVLLLLPTLLSSASFRWRWPAVRASLAFGLPKVPHGLLVQVLNLADRKILEHFHGLASTGIYDRGYTLGAGVKFLGNAFEPAWQPFLYDRVRRPRAPELLAGITTYVWAAFVTAALLVATFGRELLVAFTFTNPKFWPGAPVVPVIALAYLCHGAFLLTSVGIAIEKKARYYPVITAVAATINVAGCWLLIPRWPMMGAAAVTAISFIVMASMGFRISRRLYPIPYEYGRMVRLLVAGLAAFALAMVAARWVPLGDEWAVRYNLHDFMFRLVPGFLLPAVLIKGVAVLVFPLLVLGMGTARPGELARLRALVRKVLRRGPA